MNFTEEPRRKPVSSSKKSSCKADTLYDVITSLLCMSIHDVTFIDFSQHEAPKTQFEKFVLNFSL